MKSFIYNAEKNSVQNSVQILRQKMCDIRKGLGK